MRAWNGKEQEGNMENSSGWGKASEGMNEIEQHCESQ